VYKVLVEKPEEKRPLGRPKRRWEDVIRMALREIGWGGGVGVDLVSSAVAGYCERGDKSSGSGSAELVT
jgi:hypothetical protein